MACNYCNMKQGATYRNHGTVYCQCGEAHNLEGEMVVYTGKTGDKHSFRPYHSRKCSCGRRLETVRVPCQDSESIGFLRQLFGVKVKAG